MLAIAYKLELLRVKIAELGAKIRQQNAELEQAHSDIKFLQSFIPPWAKDVPEGLCPIFYGTLSADGDRAVKARVDEIEERYRDA